MKINSMCVFLVHYQQSELGGAEFSSGLPSPDAGGHEVVDGRI